MAGILENERNGGKQVTSSCSTEEEVTIIITHTHTCGKLCRLVATAEGQSPWRYIIKSNVLLTVGGCPG